jgi:hypothetical protein
MPLATYAKALWRHLHHFWMRHRGWKVADPKAAETIQDDLCAILFNAQGYLHTLLAEQQSQKVPLKQYRRFVPRDRRVLGTLKETTARLFASTRHGAAERMILWAGPSGQHVWGRRSTDLPYIREYRDGTKQ